MSKLEAVELDESRLPSPVGKRILVVKHVEERRHGSLVLPDNAQGTEWARVAAVGTEVTKTAVGDIVLLMQHQEVPMHMWGGQVIGVLEEDDVAAIIPTKPASYLVQ